MAGRKTPTGILPHSFLTKSSARAFVSVYVFGQLPKILVKRKRAKHDEMRDSLIYYENLLKGHVIFFSYFGVISSIARESNFEMILSKCSYPMG